MKKYITIFVILTLLASLAIWFFTKDKKEILEEQKTVVIVVDEDGKKVEKPIPQYLLDDQDRDGIKDSEEKAMGLSKTDFDTDGDNLSDISELNFWGTDPTKPDTDGDGYWDGAEIIRGYSPTGTGKL